MKSAILKNSVARAARGELVQEECYFCLADGTPRFAHRTLSPVLDEGGNLVMIVATGLDITEQKELREKLEARVKLRTQELEEKNAALLEQAETVRELSGRLLRAQDEERRRIARDLHDSSGQILVAVQMNLAPIEEEARKMNARLRERHPGEHRSGGAVVQGVAHCFVFASSSAAGRSRPCPRRYAGMWRALPSAVKSMFSSNCRRTSAVFRARWR